MLGPGLHHQATPGPCPPAGPVSCQVTWSFDQQGSGLELALTSEGGSTASGAMRNANTPQPSGCPQFSAP